MDNPLDHFQWAQARALEYVKTGDAMSAFGSMVSDLGKNPVTRDILTTDSLERGQHAALISADAVRRWIEALPAPREQVWKVEDCGTCHRPIIWAITENAKRMPVDAEPPTKGGNVQLVARDGADPIAKVLGTAAQFGKHGLRTAHLQTCPQRDVWRRRAIERREAGGG